MCDTDSYIADDGSIVPSRDDCYDAAIMDEHYSEKDEEMKMQYDNTRLDLTTAEVVKLLIDRGYKVSSPLDVQFPGQTCRVAIQSGDYVVVSRSADTNLHFDLESKSLQYLYVDEKNPRL